MDLATKVPPVPLSSSPGFIITMKDKIILDKDKVKFPHRLHKMGWIELAGLAQEIRTETKIVFFVRRHVLANISQPDIV